MAVNATFTCEECGKSFETQGRYNQHQKTHTKPWECSSCGRGFALRTDLQRHEKANHSIGHAKYACTYKGCKVSTTRKDNLKQHYKRSHGHISRKNAKPAQFSGGLQQAKGLEQLDRTTFMRAASNGRDDILKLCLQQPGFDINMKSDDGYNALHCAARAGQTASLSYLLSRSADPSMHSSNANAPLPLHEAILGKSFECFAMLLPLEADAIFSGEALSPTIDCMVSSGDPHFVQHFINNKHPDVDFHSMMNTIALAAAGAGQTAVVEFLISSYPEEIHIATRSSRSPLYLAAKRGHTSVVESLLNIPRSDYGLNQEASSLKLRAFRAAAKKGHVDVTRLLLASADIRPKEITEAFMAAADLGSSDLAGILVPEHNSAAFLSTALRSAVEQGRVNVAKYITGLKEFKEEHESIETPILHRTMALRRWPIFEILLCSEAIDVNSMGRRTSALYDAAENGSVMVLQLLLQHQSIDVNLPCKWYRDTALHIAVQRGSYDVTDLLLRHPDIDPNVVDGHGRTPLHRAIRRKHREIVDLLVSHPRIDVNATDERALAGTPLLWAIENGRIRITRRLLQCPTVDVNARDGAGRTALHKAMMRKNCMVLRQLFERPELDVHAEDRWGRTPVHEALRVGADHAQLLFDYCTLRHDLLACRKTWDNAVRFGDTWDYFTDVDLLRRGSRLITPLKRLCNSRRVMSQLIADSASWCSVQTLAPEPTRAQMLRYLVDSAVISVNARMFNGRTPLLLAICGRDADWARTLVQHEDFNAAQWYQPLSTRSDSFGNGGKGLITPLRLARYLELDIPGMPEDLRYPSPAYMWFRLDDSSYTDHFKIAEEHFWEQNSALQRVARHWS